MYICYIQPHMKTELVPQVTGPRHRTKRDSFGLGRVGLSKAVVVIGWQRMF